MFFGNVRSGQLCQIAEDDGKYHRCQQRLYYRPQGSQNGLLVFRVEIPLYEQEYQIAVLKCLAYMEIKQMMLGGYDGLEGS